MAKTNSDVSTDKKDGGEAGLSVRRALMMKNFVPDQDWIMTHVVSKGKGTKATVGRIIGVASSTRRHVNDVNGKQVESIAIAGIFEAETLDGEVITASTVYFPMAYAEMVAAALDQDGIKAVQVDVDVGLEATGKTIPYEWTVTSYVEGEAMSVLSALRRRRALGKRPASLSAPRETSQIEGKAEAASAA